MSWLDRINNIQLTIVTGEGSEFTPLVKTFSRSRNMSAAVFNSINIRGSKVLRGEAEGMRIPFEFHFTGDDNIEESERFNQASLDIRPWKVKHPIYDDLLVQPIGLNFNNNFHNDTIVTGDLFETIEDIYPDNTVDVKEQVINAVELSINAQIEAFNIESPSTELLATSTTVVNNISEENKRSAITDFDLQEVQNASNEALNSINNLTNDPITFMRRTATLARIPARFYASVQDRIVVLKNSYDDLKLAITGLSSNQQKLLFESTAGILVSSMAESSVILTSEIADDQQILNNPISDYKTRSEVIDTIELLKQLFNDYINTLGAFQSEVDATPESYTPKQDSINNAKDSINKATGQLLQIAVQTKQERKYTLPEDLPLLKLIHTLLGTTDDNTVQSFAELNEILMSEWLLLPQGREVIYYV